MLANSVKLEKRKDKVSILQVAILLLKQLRPKQWTKNLLVFAALIFSMELFDLAMVTRAVIGFLLFCFVSGAVYILNDYIDREADRQHPDKKHRPMASGKLDPNLALFFWALLLVTSLLTAAYLEILFGILLATYFVINVAYSLKLKHVVIIDVMTIAAGFVLRAIGGGLVIGVPFTAWFLMCVMLLALFLAVSKRRHEVYLLNHQKNVHRKVLDHYSIEFLDQINGIVTTATIMSYALFTFTSGHTQYLMWTLPFVIYGIFRYLYLIHVEKKGGSPEKVLLEDKPILITVILYVVAVIIILFNFE